MGRLRQSGSIPSFPPRMSPEHLLSAGALQLLGILPGRNRLGISPSASILVGTDRELAKMLWDVGHNLKKKSEKPAAWAEG